MEEINCNAKILMTTIKKTETQVNENVTKMETEGKKTIMRDRDKSEL